MTARPAFIALASAVHDQAAAVARAAALYRASAPTADILDAIAAAEARSSVIAALLALEGEAVARDCHALGLHEATIRDLRAYVARGMRLSKEPTPVASAIATDARPEPPPAHVEADSAVAEVAAGVGTSSQRWLLAEVERLRAFEEAVRLGHGRIGDVDRICDVGNAIDALDASRGTP